MDNLLPLFTLITTKDGKVGAIVDRRAESPEYYVEYYPHSQSPDEDNVFFVASSNDIVEYRKP